MSTHLLFPADPALVLVLVTVLYSYLLAGFRSDGKNIAPALRNRRRIALLPLVACVAAYLVAKLVLLGDHAGKQTDRRSFVSGLRWW